MKMNSGNKRTAMRKKTYTTPLVRWMWMGLDKSVAQTGGGVGVTGSKTSDANLPDNPWATGTNTEKTWTQDAWATPQSPNLWEEEW